MLNLSVLLEDSARNRPIVTPWCSVTPRLTSPSITTAENQVANLLVERGIQPGDKVALASCRTCRSSRSSTTALLKAGAVVVPLNVLLKGREVAYHLGAADVKAYFCFQGTPDLAIGAEGSAAGFLAAREQPDGARPSTSS